MKRTIIFTVIVLFLVSGLTYGFGNAPGADKKAVKKATAKAKKDVKDPTVYVREKGKKYHKKNCKLIKDKKGIKLSEALKKGLEPCKACKPVESKKNPAKKKPAPRKK